MCQSCLFRSHHVDNCPNIFVHITTVCQSRTHKCSLNWSDLPQLMTQQWKSLLFSIYKIFFLLWFPPVTPSHLSYTVFLQYSGGPDNWVLHQSALVSVPCYAAAFLPELHPIFLLKSFVFHRYSLSEPVFRLYWIFIVLNYMKVLWCFRYFF